MPIHDFPITKEEAERLRDLSITSWILAAAFTVGGVVIWLRFAVPAVVNGLDHKMWSATGQTFTSLLWGAAWFAGAFVFDLLFAIPKALQTDFKPTLSAATPSPSEGSEGTNVGETTRSATAPLKVNTNLEEISDWLTKILVGATLTQIVKIPSSLKQAAEFMADGGTAPVAFAGSIILYFSAIGFLAGYLLTRMFFSLAFARFDKSLSGAATIVDVLAKKIISRTSNPETNEDAYNSVVFSSLYEAPPSGFETAIKYATEFLAQNTPTRSSLYINLACAYGQQFRYLQTKPGSAEDLKKAREGALESVRKAMEIDPQSKRRFRELMHPQPESRDNDLEVFAKDPEFINLIDQE